VDEKTCSSNANVSLAFAFLSHPSLILCLLFCRSERIYRTNKPVVYTHSTTDAVIFFLRYSYVGDQRVKKEGNHIRKCRIVPLLAKDEKDPNRSSIKGDLDSDWDHPNQGVVIFLADYYE